MLLNPLARATADGKGSYAFPKKLPAVVPGSTAEHLSAAKAMADGASSALGLGTDVELIGSVPSDNPTFVERNFTAAEIAYCDRAPDRAASFAGRWTAKECVGALVMRRG